MPELRLTLTRFGGVTQDFHFNARLKNKYTRGRLPSILRGQFLSFGSRARLRKPQF